MERREQRQIFFRKNLRCELMNGAAKIPVQKCFLIDSTRVNTNKIRLMLCRDGLSAFTPEVQIEPQNGGESVICRLLKPVAL